MVVNTKYEIRQSLNNHPALPSVPVLIFVHRWDSVKYVALTAEHSTGQYRNMHCI